jgi:hypothetical protein
VPHVTNPFLFAFPTKTMTPGSILLDLWRNPYLLPSLAGFSAISRRLLLARRLSKSVYVFHVKNESSVFVLSLVHCEPLSATGFCFVLIRDAQFAISNGGDDTVTARGVVNADRCSDWATGKSTIMPFTIYTAQAEGQFWSDARFYGGRC